MVNDIKILFMKMHISYAAYFLLTETKTKTSVTSSFRLLMHFKMTASYNRELFNSSFILSF